MQRFRTLAAISIVAALGLAACGSSDSGGGSSAQKTTTTMDAMADSSTTAASGGSSSATDSDKVDIKDFAFDAKEIKVKVGTTVTWTNSDTTKHTATSDDGVDPKFDTGDIDPGKTATVTFDKAGTFAYHCDYHGNMKGTIVVE